MFFKNYTQVSTKKEKLMKPTDIKMCIALDILLRNHYFFVSKPVVSSPVFLYSLSEAIAYLQKSSTEFLKNCHFPLTV